MHIMRGLSIMRLLVALLIFWAISGCMPVNSESPGGVKPPGEGTSQAQKKRTPIDEPEAEGASTLDVWQAEDAAKISLQKPVEPIRGIYVTSHVARSRRMDDLIKLVDQTELNAMVLDINSGMALTALPTSPRAAPYTIANTRSAQKMKQLVRKLKEHRIYTIARIITFKNAELARAVPAWSIKRKDGRVWRDHGGSPWIDPYRQEAWEYPLKLAEHAASIGFDEVQFDYVRFPENEKKVDQEVAYANPHKLSKSEAIRRFLHRAAVRAHKAGARVSADVFGLVGSSEDDMGIGQSWASIASEVDVISPMIYPSHYAGGIWGIAHPDLTPRPIIAHALKDITEKNKRLSARSIDTAKVRPWYQSFTATWVQPHQTYGANQVRQQIEVSRAAGYPSYLLWNSTSRYPPLGR